MLLNIIISDYVFSSAKKYFIISNNPAWAGLHRSYFVPRRPAASMAMTTLPVFTHTTLVGRKRSYTEAYNPHFPAELKTLILNLFRPSRVNV